MKKFLSRIIIFFIIMIAIDFCFGKMMLYIESQSDNKNYHCVYNDDEDILVLGSSYAVRNIVPSIIEDSLGYKCYNAGEAGNGVLVAWARYNMFIKTHTPKLIIYTLTPEYDYIMLDDYSKYLNSVKSYYDKEQSVTNMYHHLMSWTDEVILKSNFVKYNSSVAQLTYRWLSNKNAGLQGYEPLYTSFTPYDRDNKESDKQFEIDTLKVGYLESLFQDITQKNIPIICILTPQYYPDINMDKYKEGIQICKKYDIPIVNHMYCEGISLKAEYFYDITHLNNEGAKLYSRILCEELRMLFDESLTQK